MLVTRLVLFLVSLYYCDAYKVLVVFPFPGRSHSILGEGYVRHLLEAGLMSSFQQKYLFDLKRFMYKELNLQDEALFTSALDKLFYKTYQLDIVQKFMMDKNKQFDVCVIEWLYSEFSSGFSSVFNCPLIWSSSMQVHPTVLGIMDEYPNPAYTLHHITTEYSNTFWNRVYQLWLASKNLYYKWLQRDENNRKFQEIFGPAISKRGRQLPHFDEVRYNASLMLGNSHVVIGESIALPQNYRDIEGYHIADTVAPLPKDLQELMDNAKDGAIYFSMGSLLESSKIPNKVKKNLFKIFSEFKQTVIWKLDEKIKDLPKNVHIVSWAPQQSILAHPNCKLFISHGGLLSLFETVKFGVPIIGIPFFADQYINTNRIVSKGLGKRVDISENVAEDLRIAIREILENSSYHTRVRLLSSLFSNSEESPGRRLVGGVKLVARSHGAPHLRPVALTVPLYARLYLDLALLVVMLLLITRAFCKYLMKAMVRTSKKKKNN